MYHEKLNFSLIDLFAQTVQKRDSEIALYAGQREVRYLELSEKINKLAATLVEEGLKRGDCACILFPNSIDYVIAHYAVMSAGGISVPLDNFISDRNLLYQLKDTEARFFLFDGSHWEKVARTKPRDLHFLATNLLPENGTDSIFGLKVFDLNQIFMRKVEPHLPKLSPSQAAMLLYTTGTTGRQKGVVLTHGNLIISAMNIMERCEVTEEDCELTALPLTRLFGLAHVHGYLSLGAKMVLIENLILPQRVLPLIETKRATSFPNVPTAFYILMDKYPKLLQRYGNQLRYILMCSVPCKPERYRQLKKMLPKTRIFHSYGLTEAARSTIIELDKYQDKLNSVGTPTYGMEVVILKDQDPQPPNQEGEVVLNGSLVTKGYWKLPQENERAFCKQGFRTGDLGYLDEDGFLYIVGRIKEMINFSGFKVNPIEIEEVLREMPEIEDTAVVGVPDKDGLFNEKIVAFYVSRDGLEISSQSLKDYCYKHLEKYKVPLRFELIDEIPKTVSGKIQRVRLLEAYSF